jgi:hypothetical protein
MGSMIPLMGLQPDEVDDFWPHVKPFIEKAMIRTGVIHDYDPEYVLDQLKTLRMQCWIGHEGSDIKVVHITTIDEFPKRRVLGIPFVGAQEGSIDDWIGHIEIFKEFAKAHGCSVVRGWGRKGWERKLNPNTVRIEFDIEVGHESLH